jgi:hypothetical protein
VNYLQLHDLANEKHSRLQRELLTPVAEGLYNASARRGFFFRLWARVTRECPFLLSLSEVAVYQGTYIGQMTVPIKQIIGSENRVYDFDAHFNPRREHIAERWIGVAKARLTGVPLPPVDLVQVGEGYYVRDGHHRVSVARALGEVYIEANVVAVQA